MAINAFSSPDITNATLFPEPTNAATNGRNQFNTAFLSITNQLNSDVTNKLNSVTNGGGASHVGCTNVATNAGSNIYSNLQFIYGTITNLALGEIPNNSLTEALMADEMKKDITGGVASVTALETHEDNVTNAHNYTAADVLAKLLTVDTDESGLNANTLQGHNASYFGTGRFACGNYIGSGAASRAISVGFAPSLVKIYPYESVQSSLYIASESGGMHYTIGSSDIYLSGDGGAISTKFGKLTATGFETGTNSSPLYGNTNAVTYYWEAYL